MEEGRDGEWYRRYAGSCFFSAICTAVCIPEIKTAIEMTNGSVSDVKTVLCFYIHVAEALFLRSG